MRVTSLRAPMPWWGGKRRWAQDVWDRLGYAETYLEPFAGSLAILLANPRPSPREIVCDTNAMLCNFWRAVSADPDKVAHYAMWPVIHQDLTARHKWLVGWKEVNSDKLSEDPEYFDAKVAGWWVWGISNWIGSGWCQSTDPGGQIPRVSANIQVHDKVPIIPDRGLGKGVQAVDRIPCINTGDSGRGVVNRSESITDWMQKLAERLVRVKVLNRPWTSLTSPSVLGDVKSKPSDSVAIVLDPPYLTSDRSGKLYDSDADGSSDDTARASYKWALENGERYRIAYFCHEGDFEFPEGWETKTMTFSGKGGAVRREAMDMAAFSPACLKVSMPLFGI